jgi:hypothetical protein
VRRVGGSTDNTIGGSTSGGCGKEIWQKKEDGADSARDVAKPVSLGQNLALMVAELRRMNSQVSAYSVVSGTSSAASGPAIDASTGATAYGIKKDSSRRKATRHYLLLSNTPPRQPKNSENGLQQQDTVAEGGNPTDMSGDAFRAGHA